MVKEIEQIVVESSKEIVRRYLGLPESQENDIMTGDIYIGPGSRKSIYSELFRVVVPYIYNGVGEVHTYAKKARKNVYQGDWGGFADPDKQNKYQERLDAMPVEGKLLDISSLNGAPTPKFLGFNNDTIFMQDLGDRLLLDDLRETSSHQDKQYGVLTNVLHHLVDLHLRWKGTSVSMSRLNIQRRTIDYGEELIRYLQEFSGRQVTATDKNKMKQGVSHMMKYINPFVEPEPAIIHGDCNPAHISTGHDSRLYFFDLGRLRADMVLLDLADLLYFPLVNQGDQEILGLAGVYRDKRMLAETKEHSLMSRTDGKTYNAAMLICGVIRCLRSAAKSTTNQWRFSTNDKLRPVYDAYLEDIPEYNQFPQWYSFRAGELLEHLISYDHPLEDIREIINKYIPLNVNNPFDGESNIKSDKEPQESKKRQNNFASKLSLVII